MVIRYAFAQGTGFGDIFHQAFTLEDPDSPHDKTCSIGPGFSPHPLPPATQAWCRAWLRDLESQLREANRAGAQEGSRTLELTDQEEQGLGQNCLFTSLTFNIRLTVGAFTGILMGISTGFIREI